LKNEDCRLSSEKTTEGRKHEKILEKQLEEKKQDFVEEEKYENKCKNERLN